jgi:hypothetical protein
MRGDALSRLESAGRDLLGRADAALITLGAPPEHPIWDWLRTVGATPSDAMEFFVTADPQPLRAAGSALRQERDECAAASIPASIQWHGAAGEAYARHATALSDHIGAGEPDSPASMCGRMDATASYVENIADWYEESRTLLARALAEALTSAQAVTVRCCVGLAVGGPTARVPAEVIAAAADVGAHVLAAAATAHEAGRDLLRRRAPRLAELPFQAEGSVDPSRFDVTVDLHH